MAKHATADIVVLLPGILGSVLERDGEDDATWASFVLFGNPTFRLTMNVEASVGALRRLTSRRKG